MTYLEILFLILPMLTGFSASAICGMDETAGSTVKFRPPGWVFAVMWPILYLLIGVSWVIASRDNNLNSIPYTLLIILLSSWIIVYSCIDNKKLGVFIILGSLMVSLSCLTIGTPTSRLMMTPLVGWLIFAMLMNAIEIQNIS
jgi:benzodiazapine receptor